MSEFPREIDEDFRVPARGRGLHVDGARHGARYLLQRLPSRRFSICFAGMLPALTSMRMRGKLITGKARPAGVIAAKTAGERKRERDEKERSPVLLERGQTKLMACLGNRPPHLHAVLEADDCRLHQTAPPRWRALDHVLSLPRQGFRHRDDLAALSDCLHDVGIAALVTKTA